MNTSACFTAMILWSVLTFSNRVEEKNSPPSDSPITGVFKKFFKDLEKIGYMINAMGSLGLYINIMQDEEILDVLKSGKESKNTILQNLNNYRKEGAAKIMLLESEKFHRHLKREGYSHIELGMVCTDMSGTDMQNKPEFLRGMVHSGAVFEDLQVHGVVEDDIKEKVSKIQKKEGKLIVPYLITLSPQKPQQPKIKHLFVTTVNFSFFCTKNDKGCIRTLHFDLYLDQLKTENMGDVKYPWRVENVEYK